VGRPKDPEPKVRADVLAAALDLFASNGYDATSVQQIVERAGVTKGALYHYFAAKEDILVEIYSTVFAERLAALTAIVDKGNDPEWTLRAIIDDVVVGAAAIAKQSAVLAQESSRMDQARWSSLQDSWRRYQEIVREVIRTGQSEGVFTSVASPEVASWAVFGVTNSMHTWFRPDGPKTAKDIASEVADLVISGLQPREGEHK
jgi:AcrR family transcriptional regulator